VNASIARNSTPLPRDRFVKVTELLFAKSWLQTRHSAVEELGFTCVSDESFDLAVDLLTRFHFFSLQDAQSQISALAINSVAQLGLTPANAIFVCLSDPKRVNSSQTVLNWIKNSLAGVDDWDKSHFHTSVGEAAYDLQEGETLVFADDFVGTGHTLEEKSKYVRKVLAARGIANYRFCLLALAVMQAATGPIQQCVGTHQVIGHMLQRGITDHYTGSSLVQATQAMKDAELMLSPKYRGKTWESFGYKASETLYAIDATSTPDNVFPLFWWRQLANGSSRQTVLVRA